jgi:hypothetical protein
VGVFGSFASGAFLPHGYFSDWTRCCACWMLSLYWRRFILVS